MSVFSMNALQHSETGDFISFTVHLSILRDSYFLRVIDMFVTLCCFCLFCPFFVFAPVLFCQ